MTNWDRPVNGVQRAISVRQRPAAPAVAKTTANRAQGHLLPHWTSPNGLYCGVDSDEDSGIGHSNNGCPSGDRVGSTSSGEADINSSPSSSSEQFTQYSQRRLKQWPPAPGCHQPHHIIRNRCSDGQAPSTPFTPRALFLCHRDEQIATPPMLLDSSCGSTDEVFHSFCAYLGGPSSCSNVGHHKWRPSSRVVAAGGVANSVVVCTPFASSSNSAKNWNCCGNSKNKVEAIGVDAAPAPRRRDLLLRDNDNRSRRVWSYSGESSRYANIYENMHCSNRSSSSSSTGEPMMISVRAQPLQNSVASGSPKSTSAVCRSSSGPVIRWPPQRAQSSTSLASLITVDSELIRVHATPAAVISVGDDSQPSSLQPPLPPLPSEPHPHESCHRESRSRAQNGGAAGNNYYESVHSVASSTDRQPKVRPCDLKVTTPPPLITPTVICPDSVVAGRRIVEVQYAQVQKPKKVSKKSSNGGDVYDRIDCSPGKGSPSTPDVDSEPPLPPRNYRRNSVRNVRTNDGGVGGGGSRSSLAERVHDFTRSAKQALRRALSLDALHGRPAVLERAVPKTRTSPRGWDDDEGGDDEWVDSEWRARRRPVAVNQRPCRTPAAVKAKDAARFKAAAVTLC